MSSLMDVEHESVVKSVSLLEFSSATKDPATVLPSHGYVSLAALSETQEVALCFLHGDRAAAVAASGGL